MNANHIEINDAIVNLAREIGVASAGAYPSVVAICGLVAEEEPRIVGGGYIWENYRDEHRGGSSRFMGRKTRKAVFDAVCFAARHGLDFCMALREAADYKNRFVVHPAATVARAA